MSVDHPLQWAGAPLYHPPIPCISMHVISGNSNWSLENSCMKLTHVPSGNSASNSERQASLAFPVAFCTYVSFALVYKASERLLPFQAKEGPLFNCRKPLGTSGLGLEDKPLLIQARVLRGHMRELCARVLGHWGAPCPSKFPRGLAYLSEPFTSVLALVTSNLYFKGAGHSHQTVAGWWCITASRCISSPLYPLQQCH